MTKEIFGLSGREEILATQEAMQAMQDHDQEKADEVLAEQKLLTQDDEMDMSGAGGPGEDR